MLHSSAALVAAGAALLTMAPRPAAPTAQQIVKQAEAAYRSARTLQATIQTTVSNSPVGPMVSRTDIKTVGGKKTWARMSMSSASPQAQNNPMMAALSNVQVVDDGKNTYYYSAAMQQYVKEPSGVAAQLLSMDRILERAAQQSTLTLVGTQALAGRPTWVIEATPKDGGVGLRNGRMRLFIDQATHLVDEVRISGTTPAMQGKPERSQSVVIRMSNVRINEPIPDSVFRFTPPPGAHAARPGAGMPGPMGGMMGGRPRRH